MATPHIEAEIGDIAKVVIMPGDPLRAKMVSETYLENPKLINQVRGMLGYTGTYKGKEVTVMGSGMGIPSMGIYSYELFKFYDVDTIIRVGSCGAYISDLQLLDIVLVERTYTKSSYAFTIDNKEQYVIEADLEMNKNIEKTAHKLGMNYSKVNNFCTEVFDWYVSDLNELTKTFPTELNLATAEMESFALFYNAKKLNKRAACLLSVVDSHYHKQELSSEVREKNLNKMIELALNSIL